MMINNDDLQIAPAYEGVELNLGEALLIKTIADATGRTVGAIKEELQRVGDLGLLAQVEKRLNQFEISILLIIIMLILFIIRQVNQANV